MGCGELLILAEIQKTNSLALDEVVDEVRIAYAGRWRPRELRSKPAERPQGWQIWPPGLPRSEQVWYLFIKATST